MKKTNLYAHVIIEELLRHGVDYFCLAPGSRSTPLVYEVAQQKAVRDFIHYDERGLAFHALGVAKATQKPAVIIITSGSSLANVFPAVIEAYYSQIPLILLSGDRPFELIDSGSNQAIEQANFFHKYALWHADIPLCDDKLPLSSICSTLGYALAKARKGFVHLNCHFREPFLQQDPVYNLEEYQRWEARKTPYCSFPQEIKSPPEHIEFQVSSSSVIILGKEVESKDLLAISQLAQKFNLPIFADILSKGSTKDHPFIIHNYETLLKNHPELKMETVLQFGHTFLSKTLLLHLKKNPPKQYLLISNHLKRSDPNHLASETYSSDISLFCDKLCLSLNPSNDSSFLDLLKNQDRKISNFLNNYFTKNTLLTEPFVLRHVLDSNACNNPLYIASSMPIRDAQFFGDTHSSFIYCNRGASGTDGNLATAFGISQGRNQPITVVIGDVAFLYDLNSLAQIQEMDHPPTIIVINNAGCGIFSFLPIAEKKEIYKRYFHAEHSFRFEGAALQFKLDYFAPKSTQEFKSAIAEKTNRAKLIEVGTVSSENLQLHKALDQEMTYALA